MDITDNAQVLLDNVDLAIDDAFVNGVNNGFLPPIKGYSTLTPDIREQGRQGVLTTFAAFLKEYALTRPLFEDLVPNTGFSLYAVPGILGAGMAVNYEGQYIFRGLLSCPTTGGPSVAAYLPGGKTLTTPKFVVVASNQGPIVVTLETSGAITVPATASGDWISFDNVNVWPE